MADSIMFDQLKEARILLAGSKQECIWSLQELVKALNWNDGRQRAAQIIAEYHGWEGEEGLRDADRVIQRGLDALENHQSANDTFLGMVAMAQQAAKS